MKDLVREIQVRVQLYGGLVEKLVGVAKRLDGAAVGESSLQGVKDLVREIQVRVQL